MTDTSSVKTEVNVSEDFSVSMASRDDENPQRSMALLSDVCGPDGDVDPVQWQKINSASADNAPKAHI